MAGRALRPSLPPELLRLLSRYATERTVRSGRALWYQGDRAEAACLVLEGRLRPIRVHGDLARSLEDRQEGSWLGLAETWLDLPYLSDMVAVGGARVGRVSRYNFFELLREPVFKDLVLQELAQDHYRLHAELDTAGAVEKVARAVASRAAALASGGSIRLDLTQTSLAEAAGLSRETVNRALRQLEGLGLLETGRGEILVYDLEGLSGYEG